MFAYLPIGIQVYLYVLALTVGTFLGSALNCLAWRMVRGLNWSRGRSLCPHCGHTLQFFDLIPVLSYLLLKGRCQYCGQRISPRYLLSELLLGICFASLLWRFGLTLQAANAALLCGCLLCLSLVDLEIQIIPNRFLWIPAIARIGQLTLEDRLSSGILPALLFGGSLLLFSLMMDKLLGRNTLGGGDIKLIALLGLYFSIPECLFLLIAACLLGIGGAMILKIKPGTPFPFGPYLSLAAWLTLLFGSPIADWYLSLF